MAYSDDCLLFFLCILVLAVTLLSGRVERKYAGLYARRISPTPPLIHPGQFCSPAPLNTPGISSFGKVSPQGTALEGKA